MQVHVKRRNYVKHEGWLVGWVLRSATLYRLYSAGECGEGENECACRICGVVPPCTLEQWVNSPPRIPLGVCAEFDGVKQFYTHGQWAYYILPP